MRAWPDLASKKRASKENNVANSMVGKVSRDAKRAGLFLLVHDDGRWEFLSATTGKSVLTWFSGTSTWTTTRGRRGKARSPFVAMHEAIKSDRASKEST